MENPQDLALIISSADIPARVATGETPTLFAVNPESERRFWEFFVVTIRNTNTRYAYLNAVYRFSDWCQFHRIQLEDVDPMVVAAYIEQLNQVYAAPSVKQHLAAIRMLFDWLVTGHVVAVNPAVAVRGPRHTVKVGKTPVLTAKETRTLLDSIETDTLVGLRDRALISVMVYSFGRISAVAAMCVADYYTQGKRSYFRLLEKGGSFNVIPSHHIAQEYVDIYVQTAGISDDRKGPLFRTSGRGRQKNVLLPKAISRFSALQMVKRRAFRAGLPTEICNHTFRGTGITEYLRNGGELETAARIAGHDSTRTTQIYDRSEQELTLDEIERILI
ncbi:tyrosine-type recombinase/integrase [Granulosicoccus antarcticus]|uniref:Tyrosine recombinase XerD n=1 Tax=Granulosicoccus antarcticus IMCC3135 TaxID=1192854 RepID=A0A2Z2P0P5_9GAMM|nr:tyrosine-type recombinase/integrase [Granulosicoccus antarcticus]ASJ73807.1 Tyrosine recombinase XerD [Granulosicoccus antarcticus IMCC3135]